MDWGKYINNVKSDLFRYSGKYDLISFFECYFKIPGFKYSFYIRTAKYLKSCGALLLPGYVLVRLILNHYMYKFGISIPYNTKISPGLYIGHFGGIVINSETIIGKNCNINHDVTIGAAYGGKSPGVPVIGDNVYFGPGCKVVGGITIGNNVAIGANCVLTRSVPDNAVVAGIPGAVISEKGSSSYVVNTV